MRPYHTLLALGLAVGFVATCFAEEHTVPRFHVLELTFCGPQMTSRDTPARDVELSVTFRHEHSQSTIRVPGYWDGDGAGGSAGDIYRVRFCPTEVGDWSITDTVSNRIELRGQRVGDVVRCIASDHSGLWIAEGSWYRRSDDSHPYIVGNTHYSFLSRQQLDGPVDTDPVEDVRRQAPYFTKLRFSLVGCRYPDPQLKPFLDEQGRQSDDGRFSQRPNPQWFRERVDPVIQVAFTKDLICDLILCGPDTQQARSTLQGDPGPWLRYVAARYGSYPNVWYCLCNEWNIKQPRYTAKQIRTAGGTLRESLPHETTPVSVHGNTGNWDTSLNGDWNDHAIIQWKLKKIADAADAAARNVKLSGSRPVVNDENAYQGDGDRFSEGDTIEGCLGTFLGGGYPTTGEKHGNKLGQYFWGSFDPEIHSASDNLQCLRRFVDEHVSFWRMQPTALDGSPFRRAPKSFRLLAEADREYALGSNAAAELTIHLPAGHWHITQVDLMRCRQSVLADDAAGEFTFRTPDSRAVLTHVRRQD